MAEQGLTDAIEIIHGRLFWMTLHAAPNDTPQTHYFSIDRELVYDPFFADFGPLNLCKVSRYCRMLEAKLLDPALSEKRIIHYCSKDPKRRANAACLMCLFQVGMLGKPAEVAWKPFKEVNPPLLPYRDATCGVCTFDLTILDCCKGFEASLKLRWFDVNRFDDESYEHFEREGGDMNWIVPEKFLAFSGPCSTPEDADGLRAFTPEEIVPIFREAGIQLVIRLNKRQYDRRHFIDAGIKHADMYFLDGSCPSRDIISKFLHITESTPAAVAVHCKAGLGRTGTLIGLYAMKHFNFPARAFIGWNRICRPGSILGPQQQFLVDMETDMFQAGAAMRERITPLPLEFGATPSLPREADRTSRRRGERYEDAGQGERLCNARRSSLGRSPSPTRPAEGSSSRRESGARSPTRAAGGSSPRRESGAKSPRASRRASIA